MKLSFLQNFIEETSFVTVLSILTYHNSGMELWFSLICDNNNVFLKVMNENLFLRARILNDICVVDWLSNSCSFEIIYNLFSFAYGLRFFVNNQITEHLIIESCSLIYNNACWLESEVWDMYGIFFFNNLDLRRILTDYGFEGYPLRKDFPLTGYLELSFDDENGGLVYEPVELAQNYSVFSFLTPWENSIFSDESYENY